MHAQAPSNSFTRVAHEVHICGLDTRLCVDVKKLHRCCQGDAKVSESQTYLMRALDKTRHTHVRFSQIVVTCSELLIRKSGGGDVEANKITAAPVSTRLGSHNPDCNMES